MLVTEAGISARPIGSIWGAIEGRLPGTVSRSGTAMEAAAASRKYRFQRHVDSLLYSVVSAVAPGGGAGWQSGERNSSKTIEIARRIFEFGV